MYRYVFGCNDVGLKVESNSETLINDLASLYGNYYSDQNVKFSTTIRYLENTVLDDYQVMDRESENETFNYLKYDEDTDTLSVSFDGSYTKDKLSFMQRIMCNVFIMEFQRNGYAIVHGACISKDGESFIISGNKGAGKTTTLMRLLEQGYDFISNDKVAVKEENGRVVTCGIPHSMGIIKEDVSNFNIDSKLGRIDGEKIYFRVADLGDALNVNVFNKGYLNRMIFPRYEAGREELDISECSNNLEQLGSHNIFVEDAVAQQKSYLLGMMKKIDYVSGSCINNVSGTIVKQGEDTFSELGNYIKGQVKGGKKCLQ